MDSLACKNKWRSMLSVFSSNLKVTFGIFFFPQSEEITEEFILPELCLLFQDEEATVRLAALSTITSLFSKVKSGNQ